MGKQVCEYCYNQINFRDTKLNFLDEEKQSCIFHLECYMNLSQEEKKTMLYDISKGPPKINKSASKFLGKYVTGFLLFGAIGGYFFVSSQFGGRFAYVKNILKKRGLDFYYIDSIAIDNYNLHFLLLPEKEQASIIKSVKEIPQLVEGFWDKVKKEMGYD